jgi:hypothetical protein
VITKKVEIIGLDEINAVTSIFPTGLPILNELGLYEEKDIEDYSELKIPKAVTH